MFKQAALKVKSKPNTGGIGSRIRGLYLLYKNRGFFSYVGRSVLLIIFLYAIFVISLLGCKSTNEAFGDSRWINWIG